MKQETKVWLMIVLIIITMLFVGMTTGIKWYHFIWYTGIFSIGYYLDEIIDLLKRGNK